MAPELLLLKCHIICTLKKREIKRICPILVPLVNTVGWFNESIIIITLSTGRIFLSFEQFTASYFPLIFCVYLYSRFRRYFRSDQVCVSEIMWRNGTQGIGYDMEMLVWRNNGCHYKWLRASNKSNFDAAYFSSSECELETNFWLDIWNTPSNFQALAIFVKFYYFTKATKFICSTDYKPMLELVDLHMMKFITTTSLTMEDGLSKIIDSILQLMLVILDGLLSSEDSLSISNCSLHWAPIFQLNSSWYEQLSLHEWHFVCVTFYIF